MSSNRKGLVSKGTFTSQGKIDSSLNNPWDNYQHVEKSPVTYVIWTLLAGILLVIAYFVWIA